MEDAKTGAPTPGLKAIGIARNHWHGLFRDQRGAVVEIGKVTTVVIPPDPEPSR
jgi:hypothetical protein